MNLTDKKVLFISHDALRTGAPIILLNFLKWFRDNASIPFRIILKNGGELEPEFRSLGSVSVFNRKILSGRGIARKGIFFSRVQAVANRIHLNNLRKQLGRDNIGLIYSNTVTNGEVLDFLSFLNCPVITHVHELEYWIHRAGFENFELIRQHTTHYIAVSAAVQKNLMLRHNIHKDRIDVVHGFVPRLVVPNEDVRSIRRSLNIPGDAVIVGGSGHEFWRKGKDLFVQLALAVTRKFRGTSVHFVWVGGRQDGMDFYEIQHDIKHAGLSDRVHFVAHVSNPMDYYATFDVFVMISREDPYPLVNLEIGSLHKPIVCFDNAGGTPEFVEDDAGFVIPYLDVDEMADKVIALAEDEVLRKKLGARAAQKVRERHDIEVGAPKLLEIVERFL